MPSPTPQFSLAPRHLMDVDLKFPLPSKLFCTQVLLPASKASTVQGFGHLLWPKLGTQSLFKASLGSEQLIEFFPHGQGLPCLTHCVEKPVMLPSLSKSVTGQFLSEALQGQTSCFSAAGKHRLLLAHLTVLLPQGQIAFSPTQISSSLCSLPSCL